VAIYRLSAQVIGRSSGRSATAAAAYRAGACIADERSGTAHDYSRRRGVVHTEVLAPPNAPDWMKDRERLWNAVEAVEKRRDAQLSREVQLALPHELDAAQRLELVRDFVREAFVSRGMIADLAVHAPHASGDERNHHAHVMLTLRELTGEGFGKKERAWNETPVLEGWREEWGKAVNLALERAGIAERVDHRSYAERDAQGQALAEAPAQASQAVAVIVDMEAEQHRLEREGLEQAQRMAALDQERERQRREEQERRQLAERQARRAGREDRQREHRPGLLGRIWRAIAGWIDPQRERERQEAQRREQEKARQDRQEREQREREGLERRQAERAAQDRAALEQRQQDSRERLEQRQAEQIKELPADIAQRKQEERERGLERDEERGLDRGDRRER
jgi:ATP-dependent exoDNAse (exonuclease V) alpha subunit